MAGDMVEPAAVVDHIDAHLGKRVHDADHAAFVAWIVFEENRKVSPSFISRPRYFPRESCAEAARRSPDMGRFQPLRNRIEHAQHLHADDIARFAQLDVIASVQPIHATGDMAMVDRHLGRRGATSYAFRSLLASGATLALGSDAPVETFDPRVGIHAAVTRQKASGAPAGGWYPQQRLSIDEALYGYTIGAAYAGGLERELGSIEPGKLADLTVFAQDLTVMAPEDILSAQVTGVMVGGAWVVGA